MNEDDLMFTYNDFAEGKRIQVECWKRRYLQLSKEVEFWGREYAKEGDQFAGEMFKCKQILLTIAYNMGDRLRDSDVICAPPISFKFPCIKPPQ